MAAPRSKIKREQDRAFVADKYLKQWTQQEIADELGIDVSTVCRDLQAIQEEWRKSSLIDMNEAKQRELSRIDALEREYWLAWEESKKDAETLTQKVRGATDEDGNSKARPAEVTKQRKGQSGDPRFLAGVNSCIERRCKLLGVDAPQRQDVTTGGKPLNDSLTDEERITRTLAILERARERRD